MGATSAPFLARQRLPAEEDERSVADGDVDDADGEKAALQTVGRRTGGDPDGQDEHGEDHDRVGEGRQHHADEQQLRDQEEPAPSSRSSRRGSRMWTSQVSSHPLNQRVLCGSQVAKSLGAASSVAREMVSVR